MSVYFEEEHKPLSDLVPKYKNLLFPEHFLLHMDWLVYEWGICLDHQNSTISDQVTDYCFGTLQEQLAIAALQTKNICLIMGYDAEMQKSNRCFESIRGRCHSFKTHFYYADSQIQEEVGNGWLKNY